MMKFPMANLQAKTTIAGDHTRYEWFVSYPINNYNVTFGIGKYAHFRDLYISDDTLVYRLLRDAL